MTDTAPDDEVNDHSLYLAELRSDSAVLGSLLLECDDPSMGGLLGQLMPTKAYRTIQPEILKRQKEDLPPVPPLEVKLVNGPVLYAEGGVALLDADEEIGEISVMMSGVDPAQYKGYGLPRSFHSAVWPDDGSTWWFETVDDLVTRQVVSTNNGVATSHHNDAQLESPVLSDIPLSGFVAELAEAGGREVGLREFLNAWRPNVDCHNERRWELLRAGRAGPLVATAVEFRWHPLHFSHVLVRFDLEEPVMGLLPRDDYPSQNVGKPLSVRAVGVDGSLGTVLVRAL